MFTREEDCWDCSLAMMADGPDPVNILTLHVAWEAPEGEPGYPYTITIPVEGMDLDSRYAAIEAALDACPTNGNATIHFPDGGWTWSDLRHPEGVRAVERFAPGYFQPGDPQYGFLHSSPWPKS